MSKKTESESKYNGNGAAMPADLASTAQPHFHQHAHEIQPYGTVLRYPLALDKTARTESVAILNQVLVDTISLRDLYKKHHWQVSGPTFHQLHLLYDKHFQEQAALVDTIAERVQMLGGVSIAMAADVAELTMIPRPPRGREQVPVQLSRMLEAHEMVLLAVRRGADTAARLGDQGTNDLLVGDVLRTNEMQVWFLSEHLVSAPLTQAV